MKITKRLLPLLLVILAVLESAVPPQTKQKQRKP